MNKKAQLYHLFLFMIILGSFAIIYGISSTQSQVNTNPVSKIVRVNTTNQALGIQGAYNSSVPDNFKNVNEQSTTNLAFVDPLGISFDAYNYLKSIVANPVDFITSLGVPFAIVLIFGTAILFIGLIALMYYVRGVRP